MLKYLKCECILLTVNSYGLAIYHWRKNKQFMYILEELTLYYSV